MPRCYNLKSFFPLCYYYTIWSNINYFIYFGLYLLVPLLAKLLIYRVYIQLLCYNETDFIQFTNPHFRYFMLISFLNSQHQIKLLARNI